MANTSRDDNSSPNTNFSPDTRTKWILAGGLILLISFLSDSGFGFIHFRMGSSFWIIALVVLAVWYINNGGSCCGGRCFADDDAADSGGDDESKDSN